jgi:hypothetical protein
MKTYWDLPETERAGLTEEQVREYIKYELMAAGVLAPKPPEIVAVPEIVVPTTTMYGIEFAESRYHSRQALDVVFDTADAAAKFIALRPQIKSHDYEADTHESRFMPDMAVVEVRVATHEAVLKIKADLIDAKKKREANEQAERKYNEEAEKTAKAAEPVWGDYRSLQSKAHTINTVVATYNEYTTMTGGDLVLALGFLRKAFPDETINEAFEWRGLHNPLPQPEVSNVG